MNANVHVTQVEPLKMVYVNHIGVQGLDRSFQRIIDWVLEKGLISEERLDILRMYQDSFKITSPDKIRMEIGVPLKEKVTAEFDILYKEIFPKLCVVGHFEIGLDEFEKSWSAMFIWMNQKGYRPREEQPFEIIHNDYRTHPKQKCIVDFYIPVE